MQLRHLQHNYLAITQIILILPVNTLIDDISCRESLKAISRFSYAIYRQKFTTVSQGAKLR